MNNINVEKNIYNGACLLTFPFVVQFTMLKQINRQLKSSHCVTFSQLIHIILGHF